MRTYKTILALALVFWLLLGGTGFAAAGKEPPEADLTGDAASEPVEEAAERPSEAATEKATEKATETEPTDATEKPTEETTEESTEEPTEGQTEEPTEEATGESEIKTLEESAAALSETTLTVDEFLQLIEDNEGGTVTLTGDVSWGDDSAEIIVHKPITIQMGSFGFSSNDLIAVKGPIRFIGSGEEKPLFTCRYFIAENAVVEATGKNAVAVSSSEGSRIDGAAVSPMPEDAEIIERAAFPGFRIPENGISLKVGESLTDALASFCENCGYETMQPYYYLDVNRGKESAAEADMDVEYHPEFVWENVPGSSAAAGTYTIRAKPDNVPPWYPVALPAFNVPLHIVGKNEPHIIAARMDLMGPVLDFYPIAEGSVTLFYSYDNKDDWANYGDLLFAEVSADGRASGGALDQGHVYQFRLEVKNGSETYVSNTVNFPFYDSDPDTNLSGGDRTGVDRFPVSAADDKPDNKPDPNDGNGNSARTDRRDDDDTSGSSAKRGSVLTPARTGGSQTPPLPDSAPVLRAGEQNAAADPAGQSGVPPAPARNGNQPLVTQPAPFPAAPGKPAAANPLPGGTAAAPARITPPPIDQPALPQPPFPVGAVMAASGMLLILLSGAAVYLKRHKPDR